MGTTGERNTKKIRVPQTTREITEDERRKLEQRISAARTVLLAKTPFFGHLCLNLRPRHARPEDNVPTAAVARDGTLILNYEFCDQLSMAELCGLLCHEVLHPALFCWERQGMRAAVCVGPSGQRFSLWNLCHPAGTYVTGHGPIEKIAAGDSVLTATGTAPVSQLKSHRYKGDMYKISGLGMIPFEATEDHPVLVARRTNSWYPIKLSEPEWIKASEVNPREHYLVVPRTEAETDITSYDLDSLCQHGRWGDDDLPHNFKLKGGLPLDREVAWAMGLYTANGCISNGVRWTLNERRSADRERLIECWSRFGFKLSINPRPERKAIDLTVTSSVLARAFERMFGRRAKNKRIDQSILYHQNMFVLGDYLSGYMAGDGHDSGAAETAATVSDDLIRQLQLAYARMGVLPKIYRTKQRARHLNGYDLPAGEIWTMSMGKGVTTPRLLNGHVVQCSTQRWKVADDFVLTPVKSVTRRDADEDVYNFATPDHSYAVNNALVHNCHDLSFNGQILELAKKCDAGDAIELPPEGAYEKKYDGMAAEEIYDILLKEAISNKQQGKGGDDCVGVLTAIPGGGNHGIGDDMRDDLAESKDGQSAAQGEHGAQRRLEEEWKVNILSAAQLQEQEKGKGSLPGGLSKIIEELREPRVDWKDVLSRWIGENGRRQDLTYRRPARRSESIGEYMPRVMKFGVDDVIVLWDTSGSMRGREGEILGDVSAICEDLGLALRIIMCDTEVQADVRDVRDALEVTEVKGGGGSSFLPAFKLMEEDNFEGVVVCFTDGAINVPPCKPPLIKDVLWVLGPNDMNPTEHYGGGTPWGEVLRVNDQDFKKKS